MKSITYLILSILFFSIGMNSCTLQKRKHTSGYHVQWRKLNVPMRAHKKPVQNKDIVISSDAVTARNPVLVNKAPAPIASVLPSPKGKISIPQLKRVEIPQATKTSYRASVTRTTKKLPIDENEFPENPKTHPLAVWSAALMGLGILTLPIYIGLLLVPLSIVFAVISLVQIKKYPLRYKGKDWALFSFYLLASLVVGILMAVWISSLLMH